MHVYSAAAPALGTCVADRRASDQRVDYEAANRTGTACAKGIGNEQPQVPGILAGQKSASGPQKRAAAP